MGINQPKTQSFVDTILVPKHKPRTSRSRQNKQAGSAPPRKPALPTPAPKPSKPKKRALTRQERKDLGLCRCGSKAIPEQTRCTSCAEKHRIESERRRRAKGMKPRPEISAELIHQVQQEIAAEKARPTRKRVFSEAEKQTQRDRTASMRAERASLGLCRGCGKFSVVDQTRCPDCVQKHRQSGKRRRLRNKVLKEIRQADNPAVT